MDRISVSGTEDLGSIPSEPTNICRSFQLLLLPNVSKNLQLLVLKPILKTL